MNITNHEKKQLVPKETNDATVVSNKFEDSDGIMLLYSIRLNCQKRLVYVLKGFIMPTLKVTRTWSHTHTLTFISDLFRSSTSLIYIF